MDERMPGGQSRLLSPELAGHWNSAPFDYGAMESSELGLLPDGSGWSLWANAAGGLTVTGLLWRRPEPGLLELDARWITSGQWQRTDGPWQFSSIDADAPCREVTRTRYTIAAVQTPLGGEVVQALLLEKPVEFSYRYARGDRDIHPDQYPAHGIRGRDTP